MKLSEEFAKAYLAFELGCAIKSDKDFENAKFHVRKYFEQEIERYRRYDY